MGQTLSHSKLEDRYYLQKVKLGQGSFGTVWRAIDRESGEIVAIKQLDKAAMPRRGVRKQDIEREISVMQSVVHDNITRLLDSFEDGSSIYMAFEYCDGGDFGDKVKERSKSLQEHEAAEWMRQILSAIAALHQKCICHRDIKPDNFMVHGGMIKLADFGLAVLVPQGKLLTDKCGTPAFMAPEQHRLPRYSRGYTNLCDVWAAGVTMYMLMLGGRHPFLNGSNQLDEKRLLQGTLDFSVAQGFFGFGMADSRYSEAARRLCRRMVEPDVTKRITVRDSLQDSWLGIGAGKGSADALARSASAPPAQIRARSATRELCSLDAEGGGDEVARNPSWWPFGTADENARPNTQQPQEKSKGCPETEAELKKRIGALQEQLRVQQEQNESQWEALVHTKQVMQQLGQDKAKLAMLQKRVGGEGTVSGQQLCSQVAQTSDVPLPKSFLRVGTKCRYRSSASSGWVPAVVQGFNEQDGSYNLNVQPRTRPENISPASDVPASEAWPRGTLVFYESSTVRHWLPAVVRSFNESTSSSAGTYNLDVRECAQVDRMRPR